MSLRYTNGSGSSNKWMCRVVSAILVSFERFSLLLRSYIHANVANVTQSRDECTENSTFVNTHHSCCYLHISNKDCLRAHSTVATRVENPSRRAVRNNAQGQSRPSKSAAFFCSCQYRHQCEAQANQKCIDSPYCRRSFRSQRCSD